MKDVRQNNFGDSNSVDCILAVILIRAARFKPKAELTSSLEEVFLDEDGLCGICRK